MASKHFPKCIYHEKLFLIFIMDIYNINIFIMEIWFIYIYMISLTWKQIGCVHIGVKVSKG